MKEIASSSHSFQSPETLSDFVQNLWAVKKEVFLGSMVGLVIALLYVWTAQSSYKVTMIVGGVPPISMQTAPRGSLTSSPFLSQTKTASTLSQMHQNMYRTMFRSSRVANMVVKIPDHIKAISHDKRYGLFSFEPQGWSGDDLAHYFHRKIRMAPIHHTHDLIEISTTHPNPDFAESFLLHLHALTDEIIRNDHKKLINDRRAYITKALNGALNIDHKKALGQLLIELEREAIMVNSDRSFAMRIIDPPSYSSAPYHPRSALMIVIFTLLGAFGGTLIGLARRAL